MNRGTILAALGIIATFTSLLAPLPTVPGLLIPPNAILALLGLIALIPLIASLRYRKNVITRTGRTRVSRLKPQGSLAKTYHPLPPPFKYFGGKSRLAPRIVKRIPPHNTFIEPFAGGASVTFAKPPSNHEVLSDKRGNVVRFYRHIKKGTRIRIPAKTKKVFKRIKAKAESQRTPGELVRLQGSSFGGHAQSFAAGTQTSGKLLNKRIPQYARRLANTTILQEDYRTVLRRYNRSSTAAYLDPPYPNDKVGYVDYGRPIPTPQEVKAAVHHFRGKVLISYPNLPQVREAFKPPHWRTEQLRVPRAFVSVSQPGQKGYAGSAKTRTELLITNFTPKINLG